MPIPYLMADPSAAPTVLDLMVFVTGIALLCYMAYYLGRAMGRDAQGDFKRFVESGADDCVKKARDELRTHREAADRLIEVAQDERDYLHSLLTRAYQYVPVVEPLWGEIGTALKPYCLPNPQDQRAGHPAPMNPVVGPLSDTEQK